MRCCSYCIGNALNLTSLQRSFRQRKFDYTHHGQVLHRPMAKADVYYFSNGTLVTWNLAKGDIEELIKDAKRFCKQAAEEIVKDDFSYCYGEQTRIEPHDYFNVDMITLGENTDECRLALSYALSQSIKLQTYDDMVQSLANQHAHLITDLANRGRIKMSSRKLNKIIGRIFVMRSMINLRSETLDIPKYFWQHSADEQDYRLLRDYLDIEERVSALNQKMDILNELFDVFKSQTEHHHFFVLEIIIVVLIAVEILESLPHFF